VAGIVFGLIQGAITGNFQHYLPLACLLSLGALLGDLLGSFIKRRIGIERGGAAPVLDQLGFVCLAMLLAWPFYLPGWQEILTVLIITPPIHLATNFAGYKLGMKSHPY
jgi:CDP-2,3-bis-(O-geranylgeranyl)-sn-glycerol synthase